MKKTFLFVCFLAAESVPDWEDPELQQEIQAATGIDVSKKSKRKGDICL